MSDDLIKRSDAIRTVCECECYSGNNPCEEGKGCYAVNELRRLPSADRPQGKWIFDRYNSQGVNRCSECGAEIKGYGENIPFPNCPYCLAEMRGVSNGEDIQSADE